MRSAKDAGVTAAATIPSDSRKVLNSGVAEMSLISWFRRVTTAGGVPAGARMPTQVSLENPGIVSINGGRSGNAGYRPFDVTAINRTFPLFTNGARVL